MAIDFQPLDRSSVASASKPCEVTSPVWIDLFGSIGSGVSTFARVMSKADSVTKLCLPFGWNLMPASYCSAVVGSNGLLRRSTPSTGSKACE